MQKTYSRGDMYYANLGKGFGSEQEGYRPVVIIQNNIGNRFSPTVIIAAISSKVGVKPRLPTHYFINGMNRALAISINLNLKEKPPLTMCLYDTCAHCNQRQGADCDICHK